MRWIETSAEVAACIRIRHGSEFKLYSTFSDPDGLHGQPKMETKWGLKGVDAPLLWGITVWDHYGPNSERVGEETTWRLCVPTEEE